MFARILTMALIASGLSLGLSLAHAPCARAADPKSDDVFLDEGSADDFAEPAPMSEPSSKEPTVNEDVAPPAAPAKAAAKSSASKATAAGQKAVKDAEATAASAESKADDMAQVYDDAEAAPTAAAPKKAGKAAKAKAGKPAKVAKVAGGAKPKAGAGLYKTTKTECAMHAEPSEESAKLTDVSAGKKIWVERAGDGWFKAFRKVGAGYLSADCFR